MRKLRWPAERIREAQLDQAAAAIREHPGLIPTDHKRESLEFWANKPDTKKWRSRRKWALEQLAKLGPAPALKKQRPAKIPKPTPPQVINPQPLHDGRADRRPLAYADYLRTQHWSIVRTKAVKRVGHKCENCGSGYRLNVHHLTYEHLWYEYAADLRVLCETCHAITHGAFIYAE